VGNGSAVCRRHLVGPADAVDRSASGTTTTTTRKKIGAGTGVVRGSGPVVLVRGVRRRGGPHRHRPRRPVRRTVADRDRWPPGWERGPRGRGRGCRRRTSPVSLPGIRASRGIIVCGPRAVRGPLGAGIGSRRGMARALGGTWRLLGATSLRWDERPAAVGQRRLVVPPLLGRGPGSLGRRRGRARRSEPPTVPDLYFWALQVNSGGPGGAAGGAPRAAVVPAPPGEMR
jgi:hypothetical protein